MRKFFVAIACAVILFSFIGCGQADPKPTEIPLPLYKVEGEIEYTEFYYVYITVSGDYGEEGLEAICQQKYFDSEEEYIIFFFAPNAPRYTKKYEDVGMPDREYNIATFVVTGKDEDREIIRMT